MKHVALITGVNGQDGSYLAELLLGKGYRVYGLIRRSSHHNLERLTSILDRRDFHLSYGDVTDAPCIYKLMSQLLSIDADQVEIYNLAAQSHVGVSFVAPIYTGQVDAMGPMILLEAIRCLDTDRKCRFYQASTSELYGKVLTTPQTELTPFNAQSPYAVAKQFAFYITKLYREAYGMFAVNGILFNHESERRGHEFVTRKISLGVAAILRGDKDVLEMGNLDAQRDWGYAPEYVEMMWRMLQTEEPDDYVAATGETHSVRECIEVAFGAAGIVVEWKGKGVKEEGFDAKTGKTLVRVNPEFFRPAEVDLLLGDASKAKTTLGWKPTTTFVAIIERMVRNDMGVSIDY